MARLKDYYVKEVAMEGYETSYTNAITHRFSPVRMPKITSFASIPQRNNCIKDKVEIDPTCGIGEMYMYPYKSTGII